MKKRVLIFIVCYNAANFIESVLDRIPAEVWSNARYEVEILMIDDASTDETFDRANSFVSRTENKSITVLYNPKNQGYGGNQKLGYYYAIEHGFDVVLLLHGDGQYPPELIPAMILPILDGEADVVLGSRMMNKRDALKGGMPLYKWIGNQVLTFLQNRILGAKLAEFHTGYRAYSIRSLKAVPFAYNSDYFDFDTDILIQMLSTSQRIKEIPIPTFYGTEISRVNGFRYGALILRSSFLSRIQKLGLFYHPRFDYETNNSHYQLKLGYPSSHQFALAQVQTGMTVMDIGCGPGAMSQELAARQIELISIDRYITPQVRQCSSQAVEADIEAYPFDHPNRCVDLILALDIIEHLKSPEAFLGKIREQYCKYVPTVVITTGNIGFFPIRGMLLLGQFNYGKQGILDLDHARLFTFGSLRRTLIHAGYEIVAEKGIPAPFPRALGDGWLARLLLKVNGALIYLSKGLFSYQMAFIVKPKPTLSQLVQDAQQAREAKLCVMPGAIELKGSFIETTS